jgi:anti-sigma factor ChrR (cupin superfamily)
VSESDPLENRCGESESTCAYAVGALSDDERAGVESHIDGCDACRRELAAIERLVGSFASWPTDVLKPPASLQSRLADRLAAETGSPAVAPVRSQREPQWRDVAPGIACKLFSSDQETSLVAMLVRLAPGAEYPPHTHAGLEELHLLDGELWIDARKLFPGDYSRAEPGTADRRVWSETGCTCVLITSSRDALR